MIFCKYLYNIVREKNLTIEDIVKKTNRSYTEIKRILEGLISPSLDDLLLIADLLGIHVTLTTDTPLGHKKVERFFPQFTSNPVDYKNFIPQKPGGGPLTN